MTQTNRNQKKFKIRKGDTVQIMVGRSKGEQGEVEEIDFKRDRVFISGKNLGKRHQKPDMNNHDGGIVDVPMPVHVSNVMVVDPKSKKPSRVGYRKDGDKKVRFAKGSGSPL